jgi:hypothetical protein
MLFDPAKYEISTQVQLFSSLRVVRDAASSGNPVASIGGKMRTALWFGLLLCLSGNTAVHAQSDDDEVAYRCTIDNEEWIAIAHCPRSVTRESVSEVTSISAKDGEPTHSTIRTPISVPVYEDVLYRDDVCDALRRHVPVWSHDLSRGGSDVYQRNLLRDRFGCVH